MIGREAAARKRGHVEEGKGKRGGGGPEGVLTNGDPLA